MKLSYKNACSMRQADFNFERGKMYLISGGNNSGKSAVFYTLSSALLNTREATNYINNEALKGNPDAAMEVTLQDDKNNEYTYSRTKSSAAYWINGKEVRKLVRKNVFDVIDGQIDGLLYDPDDNQKIVNIQGEDNRLFPFDRSEGEQFKLFERIFNISSTTAIIRSANMDEDDVKCKIVENVKSIDDNKRKLEKINTALSDFNIEEIQRNRNELVCKYNDIININNDINTCNQLVNYINKAATLDSTIAQLDIGAYSNVEQDVNRAILDYNYIYKVSLLQQADIRHMSDNDKQLIHDCNVAQSITNDKMHNDELTTQYSNKLSDVNVFLSNIDICPLCKRPMEGDTLCTQ